MAHTTFDTNLILNPLVPIFIKELLLHLNFDKKEE